MGHCRVANYKAAKAMACPIPIVRKATDGDLDAVAHVWHESASSMDGTPVAIPSISNLRARIEQEVIGGWHLYIAERDQVVVGMLAIKPHDQILDQIFVLQNEQRSGVGSVLMNIAKQAMPAGFMLRMAAENHRAAQFYRRTGMRFSHKGRHPTSGRHVHFYVWNSRSQSEEPTVC